MQDTFTKKTDSSRVLFRFFFPILFSLSFQLFLQTSQAYANNVIIENVELVDQNTQNDTIEIQFDISWENAYADLSGADAVLDAVWVIAKIENTFTHLTLDVPGLNPAGFQRGTMQAGSAFDLLDIMVSEDRRGAWIQPGDIATGKMDFHDVSLVWSYAENGYTDSNADDQNVELIGIEMVYIHEGAFVAGDTAGAISTGTFALYGGDDSGNVDSEGVIRFRNNSTGLWYYYSAGLPNEEQDGASFDLPGGFPKGYQGFYIMKHEISYGLWNQYETLLSGAADTNHSEGSGNDDYEAVTNIHWYDLAAFCDFAALRPMTELEYEKAALGTLASGVENGYAWGGESAFPLYPCDTLTGSTSTESCTTTLGNASITNTSGVTHPTRVGMYATSGVSAREDAGASYYGVLDLTGNVAEMVVSVGHPVGRGYQGTHGDGTLVNGNATNMDWPGSDPGTPSTGVDDGNGLWGVGLRGGGWSSTATEGEVCDRTQATDEQEVEVARNYIGGRCVRTAPRVQVTYFENQKS